LAITDSAYTGTSGYFNIYLALGLYDLEYTHIGFDTVFMEDQVIVDNTTLLPVTLQSVLVMVDGFCYLEGESDHSNTKLKFIKANSSAVTDSTYTDSLGHFIMSELYAGIYDVKYTHNGFDTVSVEDQVLTVDTTLSTQYLELSPELYGPLAGFLGPGYFRIVGNISVVTGDSLVIMPGTTLCYEGEYGFSINGILVAEGTIEDSIFFVIDTTCGMEWRGNLCFTGAGSSGSRLAYCLIQKGRAESGGGICFRWSSPTFANCTISANSASIGGGVDCGESSPTFTNCSISGNSAETAGGVDCFGYPSSPIFTNCTIAENSADYGGGAYCWYYSSPTFTNCAITENTASDGFGGGVLCSESSPVFTFCTISGNAVVYDYGYGGGVECEYSSPTLTNCSITGNSATYGGGICCWYFSLPIFTNCTLSGNSASDGGGLYVAESSSPAFTNCMISRNTASDGNGGGLYCDASSPVFVNCTTGENQSWNGGGVFCDNSSPNFTNCTFDKNFVYNIGGGMYCVGSSPTFRNCSMSGNTALTAGGGAYCAGSPVTFRTSIIALSSGSGIVFNNSANSQISYCDIFGNSEGNIVFNNNDPSQGPLMIGRPFVTNDNGDSCDIYMNIFVDPMFADTGAGDYHLTDFSHCIGAGDPTIAGTDFEGDPRPNPSWSFSDIGADEHWSGSPVLHLVVSMVNGNARLNWTPFGAGPYSVYGATEPNAAGTLLATVSDTTTWADEETANRPMRYFYYVMLQESRRSGGGTRHGE
jgi:hypothetical protein